MFNREAGQGELNVSLKNEDARTEIPLKVTDNEDGTYTVDYQSPLAGNHTVTLHYGGLLVPSTPIKFKVQPNVDVSKIIVDGLEPSKYNNPTIFFFLSDI